MNAYPRYRLSAKIMKHVLKQILKKGFHALGVEVTRHRPESSEIHRFGRLLREREIGLVVDVGANKGGFAGKVRAAGYAGPLISFEPLQEAHQILQTLAAESSTWTIAPRMALGAEPGEARLHVAGNSSSSSLLPMLKAHEEAAPGSAYIAEETVQIQRLDGVLPGWLDPLPNRMLLKIDTQGYERQVLEGAAGILDKVDILQLELSLLPLYEGQWLLEEALARLNTLGYTLWSLSEVFADPRSGRLLQVDGVFVREDAINQTQTSICNLRL